MDIKLRNRLPTHCAATLGLLLALVASGNANANQPAPPQGSKPVSASATLHFRIVIPETIRIGGEQRPQRVSAPATSRTVTLKDGRQVVTTARP